jgi:hypothetical protein
MIWRNGRPDTSRSARPVDRNRVVPRRFDAEPVEFVDMIQGGAVRCPAARRERRKPIRSTIVLGFVGRRT